MECPTQTGISINNDSDQHHRIYKVDVGVSRAFDNDDVFPYINNETAMKKYFLSRVPQVLEFQGDNVRILRSTLQNTRIHQVREKLEKDINAKISTRSLPQDMAIQNMTYGGYKQKYLKYKQKYLKYKQLMNL